MSNVVYIARVYRKILNYFKGWNLQGFKEQCLNKHAFIQRYVAFFNNVKGVGLRYNQIFACTLTFYFQIYATSV